MDTPAARSPVPWRDAVVGLRETLLRGLLDREPDRTLNPLPAGQPSPIPPQADLASEILRDLKSFKAGAMDATGAAVDYPQLAASRDYRRFQRTVTPALRSFDPQRLPSQEARTAFWINLYNALILDAVIQLSVRKSVTERLGLLRFFRRAAYCVGGLRVSADDIEHGILRANRGNPAYPGPQFKADDPRAAWSLPDVDPRIHFALNCASRSCPPIATYSASDIHEQLDASTASFVSQETQIFPERAEVRLSSIFRWYRRDFGDRRDVLNLLLKSLPATKDSAWLAANQDRVRIRYRAYDWRLNALR